MTPKKQKIYIALIIICLLGAGGVLYFGLRTPAAPASPIVVTPVENTTPTAQTPSVNSPSGGGAVGYGTPTVFPNDTKFDWSVLDSANFKALVSLPDAQQNLVLDPTQIGRDNPFKPY